jgi:hypothetical protein
MHADASRRLGTALDDPMEIEAVVRGALPILGDLAMLDLVDGTSNDHKRIKLSAGASARPRAKKARAASLLDDPRFELGPSTVA